MLDALHELRRHAGSERDGSDITETSEDEVERGFRVTLAANGLLSLLMFEVNAPFMFRPSIRTSGVTYALSKAVRRVHLADLGWEVDYRKWLSEFCTQNLLEQNEKDGFHMTNRELIEAGTARDEMYCWQFALGPTGILIAFDAETTGPLAWGPHDVLVPYVDLRSVLQPDGLLEALLKS